MFETKTIPLGSPYHGFLRPILSVAVVLLLLPNTLPAGDVNAPGDEPAETPGHASTFALPQTLDQGRDPFFPTSTRFFAMSRPQKTQAPGPAKLELKGISGTPDRPLAIINNRTLGVGEAQDVTTSEGRVRVYCLAIDGMKVTVRAQGQTRELMLRKGI